MCVCVRACVCVVYIHAGVRNQLHGKKAGVAGQGGGESVSMVTWNLNKTSSTTQITVALSVATSPPSNSLRQPTAGPSNLPAASESLPFSLFPLLNLALYNS